MAKPLKVLHVSLLYSGVGGVETYVRNSTAALARRGHQITVLAPASQLDFEAPPGVEARWLHESRSLFGRYNYPTGLLAEMRRMRQEIDVVHAYQPFSLPTMMASLMPCPRVVTYALHPRPAGASRFTRQRRLAQLRWITGRFNHIAAVSEAERALLRAETGRAWPVTVCWPGFDEYGIADPEDSRKLDHDPYLVSVGSLTPHKQNGLAISAVGRLGTSVHLELIGSGPDRPVLVRQCQQSGLDPAVTLVGQIPPSELQLRLRRRPIYLALSTEESFGISLAEAIGAGAVPIASDIPSHREIIRLSGWGEANLVPPNIGAAQLAQRIADWLRGDASRRHSVPIPTWDDTAWQLEQIYRKVAGTRKSL